MRNHSIDQIKTHAFNRWPEILLHLAPHLARLIERGRKHGPCPLCAGKDRARCFDDFDTTGGTICNQCGGGWDGIKTLEWANNWSFKEAAEALESHLGLADGAIPTIKPIPKPELQPEKDWEVEKQRLQSIWDATESDNGRIAEYFQHRGLDIEVPLSLRLHPSFNYYHQGPPVKYPAMIGRIQRNGETVGLHLTYLDVDGPDKAPVSQPRKIRKCVENISGGAVRLFQPKTREPLILCEGIETALAARKMMGLPAWSCLNAGMLENADIPDSISEIVIAGDNDKNNRGQKAMERLAERLHAEGKRVQVALPPGPLPEGSKSLDWLDVMNKNLEVTHA